ncbi:MAG: alpha/beta hydrolase [Bdellovibrionales bacterium]|nr:alpha/beta hydrolase [Bdellovibrionales bacterium]
MLSRVASQGFFFVLEYLVKTGERPLMLLLRFLTWLSRWMVPLFMDRSRVERIADLSYGESREQRLDVIRPKNLGGKLPVVFLVHGGGFQYFSKGSHAVIAQRLALMGHVVFNIDYRLAPESPFPLAMNDVVRAYAWVLKNAESYGGDPSKIHWVGESAGSNLLAGLLLRVLKLDTSTVEGLDPLPSGFPPPAKAVLHCGFMQVSNPERWDTDSRASEVSRIRIRVIQRNYMGKFMDQKPSLSDPLLTFEKMNREEAAKLPPIFVPVGDLDWVYTDSKRLGDALERLGSKGSLFKSYPNQGHAFYFKWWGKEVPLIWKDIGDFLK